MTGLAIRRTADHPPPLSHPWGILVPMDVVGRCEAPGCQRSTRVRVEVLAAAAARGAAVTASGLACPRHVTQTELGALLWGWSVERRA